MEEEEIIINAIITLQSVIYPRGSRGNEWCICRAIVEKEDSVLLFPGTYISIKGDMPELEVGMSYQVIAKETEDKYGKSYILKAMFPNVELTDKKQITAFLQTILTEKQLDNLFEKYQNPMTIIEKHDVESLCAINGIKEATAQSIIDRYEQNKKYKQAFVELCQYNLTTTMIKKIVDAYGNVNEALNVVLNDPYRLAGDVESIGFVTADDIGKKIGIIGDDVRRIKGYIRWFLNDLAQEGYSWITPNTLCEQITGALGLENTATLKLALTELKDARILTWDAQKGYVALTYYYELEQKIANELKRLYDTRIEFNGNELNNIIHNIETEKNIKFTDEQVQGAKNIIENPIAITIGKPGVGKTFSAQIALNTLKINYDIASCSFSGKASARLTESTGFKSSTIHKLLEYNPKFKAFMRNKYLKLTQDIVVIDECSFLDGKLFLALLEAMKDGSKLVMLGDINQLEPIGSCAIFKDMINSKVFSTTELTKIHRQAQDSGIITESHRVCAGQELSNGIGEGASVYGNNKDFITIVKPEIDKQAVLKLFQKEYEKYNDITKVQGLSALRTRGEISILQLNNLIQEWYNPITYNDGFEFLRDNQKVYIHPGDKVINIMNNYDAMLENGDPTIIYNGYTGIVKECDAFNRKMKIDFGKNVGVVIFTAENFKNLELAYFLSVNKYQGSECESIIICYDISAYKLLTRNYLYTAITRAKRNCILYTTPKALKRSIYTENISKKQTFLKDMLIELFTKKEEC